MLFFTVYGGAIMGHYLADKVTGTFPSLSCAYDQKNAGYCVLIPMQHQLHHRVGESNVRTQQFSVDYIIPFGFMMLSFLAFFCGLEQSLLWLGLPARHGSEIDVQGGASSETFHSSVYPRQCGRVRPVEWAVLILLVLILPLMAGLGYTSYVTGDANCQVCPSRVVTTLLTTNGEQIAVNTADTTAFCQTAALMGEILLDVIEGNLGHCLIGGDAVAGGFGFDRVWCCDTS